MNRNQMSWVPIYNQVNLSVIQRFPSVIFIDTLSVSRMHHNTKPHITDADMKVTTGLKLRCKGPSLALNVRHFFLGSFSILIQPVAQWCSGNESGEVVSPILYTTSNPGSFLCSPPCPLRNGWFIHPMHMTSKGLFWKTTFKVPSFHRGISQGNTIDF